MGEFKEQTLLDGVTATSTSVPMNVEGYEKIGVQVTRADHSSGSSTFTFEGTIDGTNWVALNIMVTNVTNTNSQDSVRTASVALSSNTSSLVWLEARPLKAIRVKVTEVTDGTHSAHAIASK